ncbi:hypothetical protein [Roseomonas harenae]|jgi:hypothetical protein|uniref:hypothetical protein n=1 Tax=Muricoccus harenae TaxID=2692566 RepID=UPI001331A1E0|nr:hypothetical protein [Roseomonas harenae]
MMTARPVLFGALLVTSLGLLPACTPDRTPDPAPGLRSERDRGAPLPSAGSGAVTTGSTPGVFERDRVGAPMTPTTQGTVTTGGSTGMRLDGRGGAPTTPTPSGTAGTLGGTAR